MSATSKISVAGMSTRDACSRIFSGPRGLANLATVDGIKRRLAGG